MKKVTLKKETQSIPTYIPKRANELPMFFEKKPYQGASGKLYPIPYSDGITDEKRDVDYTVYSLENEYIYTSLLPDVGGKLLRAYDKVSCKDFLYYNEVIKPALVGLAGAWISGGIEFNWPQHHRPTTFMPLEVAVEESEGSKTVWMGEVDPLYSMKGMVGITLDEGRSYIKAKIRLYNRSAEPKTFMWWANMAFPANENVRTVFPPDVEWVNDHDRRAVLSYPMAKGLYRTARPFDYGDGTDLSLCESVKVPSSFLVSQGQSDMDFVGAYDNSSSEGFVTVANHHIAPGKKMWHWGVGDFGEMWCSNLTDRNGPYIEIMAGVYTDNQPDFTFIMPYESKEFEQYWYPIRDIGEVKNASIDAAINLERRGDDIYLGLNVTGVFNSSRLELSSNGEVFYKEILDLSPDKSFSVTIPMPDVDFNSVTATLYSESGRVLISYKPYIRGSKKPIEPRLPVKRPCEIENLEELYLNALHLEQYKQHNYDPLDYYMEGLKRDPMESRFNTAVSRLALASGEYMKCVEYADRAISRLTIRNMHPLDTEALYNKGLALKALFDYDGAYNALWRAAWGYTHRAAAYFALAQIDAARGSYKEAIEKLDVSLSLGSQNERAKNLKVSLLRLVGETERARALCEENAKNDPLDMTAASELSFYQNNDEAIRAFIKKSENMLTVLSEYIESGLYSSALALTEKFISLGAEKSPMLLYYKAYCLMSLGEEYEKSISEAESLEIGYTFPSTACDLEVLEALSTVGDFANVCYFLGCIYFDRKRYSEARAEFEECVSIEKEHGRALRCLSLLYFDKFGEKSLAKDAMERALKYRSGDPRLLFEYQQLLKNMNYSPRERLSVYEKYPLLLAERDDCYLDTVFLTTQIGEYQKAIDMAKSKRFHIYEGGEGKLTKLHAWMHVLLGNSLYDKGDIEGAEKAYTEGAYMPKSYGEAKTFFNQEAHIYYNIGVARDALGLSDSAREAYEKASEYKAAVSPISLWRALSLARLGNTSEAERVIAEMISTAEDKLENRDMRAYYGVGSPSPMPFEYDIVKQNTCEGSLLKAFALLYSGNLKEAESLANTVRALDPYNFDLYIFDMQKSRII